MAGFSLSIVELRPHRVDEAVDSKPPPDGGSIARRGRESEMVVSTQKPFTLRVALVDGQGLVVHADVHVPLKASTSQQPDIDSLVASTHDLLTEFGSD
mmetsp:Transcript_379/g.750  ORF Transcript_379/g.750 Transcript_379/m.750 type:complete len:98 (-) Transcript_379:1230-1523(-)